MRIKPYKGKFVFRGTANEIKDLFLAAKKPDRTALEKEAMEFEAFIKQKRSLSTK